MITSIQLSGQLTFTDTQNFKPILELVANNEIKAVNLDFTNVTFIDSAGMGMLLLLRDECQKNKIALSIHSITGQVEKIFNISKFDQLFSIHN
jgi:anti-anti-sigma factor